MRRKELIAAQDGITIRYTGEQLDQADLDVWEQALHLARTTGARHPVPVHGERLSQGAWPSVRQERSRMAEVCLCSADGYGGRDL